MTSWESPQQCVAGLLEGYGLSASRAEAAAGAVFDSLREADRDMLEAGAMELRAVFGTNVDQSRKVAERVWIAMLRRACT